MPAPTKPDSVKFAERRRIIAEVEEVNIRYWQRINKAREARIAARDEAASIRHTIATVTSQMADGPERARVLDSLEADHSAAQAKETAAAKELREVKTMAKQMFDNRRDLISEITSDSNVTGQLAQQRADLIVMAAGENDLRAAVDSVLSE